jgi:hypothetical protein
VRWQKAEADLSTDFLGNKLDLGGFTYQATFTVQVLKCEVRSEEC